MSDFTIDITGTEQIAAGLGEYPRRAQKVIVRAMNRAIDAARTVMVREIARDTGLKQKDVREALRVQHANFDQPVAELAAKLKRIPLYDFAARGPFPSRGRGRGVSYLRRGVRTTFPEAFIARMDSGHMGVFTRGATPARKSSGAWSKNLPIQEQFGPSLGRVFKKYRPQGLARLQEAFRTNLTHDLARALKGQAGGGAD